MFDRGEAEEAEKLIERALGVEGASSPALLLKAKILALQQKDSQAIALLEEHPEADAGGEVTDILLELGSEVRPDGQGRGARGETAFARQRAFETVADGGRVDDRERTGRKRLCRCWRNCAIR